MHRSRQRQGRRPHDARDVQSALRADRHGRVPAGQTTATDPCCAPCTGGNGYTGYDAADRGYVTDTINGGYKAADGTLEPAVGSCCCTRSTVRHRRASSPAAHLVQRGAATGPGELLAHGRPDVPDYIVFLTDGEANIGSVYGSRPPTRRATPTTSSRARPRSTSRTPSRRPARRSTASATPWATRNCTAGELARRTDRQRSHAPRRPGCYHYATASTRPGHHVVRHAQGDRIARQLLQQGERPATSSAIFAAIATDIGQGSSRLVDDNF